MSDAILGGVNAVVEPFKSLVFNRIGEYFNFIMSYDDNMSNLETELGFLCSKKEDIVAKVKAENVALRVVKRETTNWLQSVQELIERDEMKELMKKGKVAGIVVKMMEQRGMKRLWEKDIATFEILVQTVTEKGRRQDVGNREVIDAEEDDDYEKIATIARDVVRDIVEDLKKVIKDGDGALSAVKQLDNDVLEKLMKSDDEIAKKLTKAEEINRKYFEHEDHRDKNVNRSNIQENVKHWRTRTESLREFLIDENFKKSLPDSGRLGLEGMLALTSSPDNEQKEVNDGRQHRCCGCCVSPLEYYRHRHDFSQKAEFMTKLIKTMIERCPQGSVTRPKRPDELETISSSEFMEGLKSREDLLQNILSALKKDGVNVVGIHGMVGAGKTTLAKTVANKRANNYFNKSIVVEVSEPPNIKGIQDQIAEELGLKLKQSVHGRATELYSALKSIKEDKNHKILIILNNVGKKLNLDEVGGIAPEKPQDFCCKFLITTRDEQVCRDMGVENCNIFRVGFLNEEEALALFENKIGKKVEGGYKSVADKLLNHCDGLPLAIAATASALKDKDLSVWNRFAKESVKPVSSEVGGKYREIYSILETSIKLMENEEKKMFFYLACLSPHDSPISVDDLMRYGIGWELFQRVDNLSEAMKQASDWANELVSSSLLMKDDLDEIRIHDVVRDSAISFVEKAKDGMMLVDSIPRWMSKETLKKFRVISLLSGHHDFCSLSGVNAPMLQILLLKGDNSTTTLSSNFFQGMTNLKVLSLSNMDFSSGLPTSIGQLQRLKTLHLHNCRLEDIKLIARLGSLFVLSLRGSTFKELPVEFGELCNLRLLDIRVDDIEIKINIPGNILSRLSHLEGLYTSNSSNDLGDRAILSELNNLSHLNVLEMEVPRVEQLLTVNDDKLVEQLDGFKIFVGCCGTDEVVTTISIDDILRFWERPRSINTILTQWEVSIRCALILGGIDASRNKFLKVILKKTVCLVVVNNGSLTENFVPQLDEDGFKDLICLSVINRDDVQYIISPDNYIDSPAFVNLQILELINVGNLKMICDGNTPARSFSCLQKLKLQNLPSLKYGLPLIIIPLNLVKIHIHDCDGLKYIFCGENAVTNVDTDILKFPALKTMFLKNVPRLSSVVGQGHGDDDDVQADQPFFHNMCAFPCLEYLRLCRNTRIMTLWSNTYDISSFHNLKSIGIYDCTELRSLGSPFIFHAFVHLEGLSIMNCDKLQHVITKETTECQIPEHAIKFARLEYLSLCNLSSLESFYGGSYKLEFCSLEYLYLDVPRLTHFVRSENSTSLFCDKSTFTRLETLVLVNNEAIVTLWRQARDVSGFQNLKSLVIRNCGQLQSVGRPSVFAALVNLENLSISDCHNLQEVVSDETDGQHFRIIEFRHLEILSMGNLSNLKWFCPDTYTLKFPMLNSLTFRDTSNLIDFVRSQNSTTLFSYQSALSSIERLSLGENQTIVKLWSETVNVSGFQNLKVLVIWDCKELQCLGPMSVFDALVQLEGLDIRDCHNLQQVICDQGHEACKDIIAFSRLKLIHLDNLPNLQTFYRGYTDSLNINFVNSESSNALFSNQIKFPRLEKLEVRRANKVLSLWNLTALGERGEAVPNFLKNLEISDCENMDVIIAGEHVSDQVYVFPRLKSLKINKLPSLTRFAYKPSAGLRFPSLEQVKLETCTKLQSFCSGPCQTPKLKSVIIRNCGDMLFFLLVNMSVIQELPSLEKVKIEGCPMLLSFTCEPLDTPSLRVVLLRECPKMKWFSPGDPKNDYIMLLPCLNKVTIKDCSSMQSFCAGQIDAPKLRVLKVDGDNVEFPLLQNLQSVSRTPREVKEDSEKESDEEFSSDASDSSEDE